MKNQNNQQEALPLLAEKAKRAARVLSYTDTDTKNKALEAIADALCKESDAILQANRLDVQRALENGMSSVMVDRLSLTQERIESMAKAVRQVVGLEDPVGTLIEGGRRPNGLMIQKVRVPLGVCGIIYESRPNVTVDAAVLCLKAGNAAFLRGGKEALASNICLSEVMREAISPYLPKDSVILLHDTSRETAAKMMRLNGMLDVLIPRGGAGLIRAVVEQSTVPVIETGVGNCHIYVEQSAEIEMACNILVNAKTSRPSVCNAAESLLVDEKIAADFLRAVKPRLDEKKVELRGCEKTREILGPSVKIAGEEDYAAEFLDYILAVKVVEDFEEAVAHITRYSTGHSECIVTRDYQKAQQFTSRIDAAAVYVNASTRFTDGGEFGLGAEIGISTQKLHARGPMGLKELTSMKYIVLGNGQIR